MLADMHFQGIDIDGFIHAVPPNGWCVRVSLPAAIRPHLVRSAIADDPRVAGSSVDSCGRWPQLAPMPAARPLEAMRTHEPSAACSMTMRVSSTREAMLSLRKAWRR